MTETMKREGHKALVHTAAASNLGQMLNKICNEDGIGLVNIVRSPAQAKLLKDIGAKHVVDLSAASFTDDLTQALVETGATIAFDAIGGGKLVSQILTCMEIAINKTATTYNRYGSSVHKQVYVYGSLDTSPVELTRNYGMAWGVGGWLLTPFLQKIGRPDQIRLRERVVKSLKTTFASHYTHDRLAPRGAGSQEHRRLRQARDRREVPDQPEQGLTHKPRKRKGRRLERRPFSFAVSAGYLSSQKVSKRTTS